MSTRAPLSRQDAPPQNTSDDPPTDPADGADEWLDPATDEPLELSHRNERTLHILYWHYGLSQRETADVCDVTKKAITKWMKRLGVETRTNGGHNPFLSVKGRKRLKRLHEDERKSPREIAELPNVEISKDTVQATLERFDADGFLTYTRFTGGYKHRMCASRYHYGLNEYVHYEVGSKRDAAGVVRRPEHVFVGVGAYGIDVCCDVTGPYEPAERQNHHQNMNKFDNRPSNLLPVDREVHEGWHAAFKSTPHVFVAETKLDPADAVADSLVIDAPDDAPANALAAARADGSVPHEGIEIPVREDGSLASVTTEGRVVIFYDEDGQPSEVPQPTDEKAVKATITALSEATVEAEVHATLAEIETDVDADLEVQDTSAPVPTPTADD